MEVPPPASGLLSTATMADYADDVDLLSTPELAELLGLPVRIIRDWRQQPARFPQPVVRHRGYLWSRPEVERWAEAHAELLTLLREPRRGRRRVGRPAGTLE
jgi:hypothetical protein